MLIEEYSKSSFNQLIHPCVQFFKEINFRFSEEQNLPTKAKKSRIVANKLSILILILYIMGGL